MLPDFRSRNTQNVGSNQAPQFNVFVIELTDNRFIGKLGTCKTGFNDIDGVQLIVPDPIIGAEDPSAIRTLSFPEHGL
jgi:hypothetical protein